MPTALSIVKRFFPEVTEVKDAGRNAMIEVTPRDSTTATRKSHKTCAMAIACKRKFDLNGVIISVKTAYLVKGDVATRYKLPESVSREIVAFDRNSQFAPGTYKMLKPDVPLGARVNGNGHGTRPGKHTEPKHMTEGIRTVLGSAVE